MARHGAEALRRVDAARGWTARDADAVLAACQDPDIQRWMEVPVPYLPEHAAEFVGEHNQQQWSSQQGAPFAIAATDNDQVLGSCGLVAVNAHHLVAEVVCGVTPSVEDARSPSGPCDSCATGR